MIQPSLGSFLSQRDANERARTERLERTFEKLLRPETDVVHGVAAVSLGLDDIPELAICTCQNADIRRLASAFWKDDRVVEDHLQQWGTRGWGGLLLFALAPI